MRKTTYLSVERLLDTARRAYAGGYGRMVLFRDGSHRRVMVLDVKHNCEQPYEFELHARWSRSHHKKVKPFMIRGTGRCRKCEACKMFRAWTWRQRAAEEFRGHQCTLFGTFTMSPEQHYLLDARIASGAGERPARDLRGLPAKELFAARVQAFGDELQRWLKLIRKGKAGEKPSLRYLLVAEMHDGSQTGLEMRGRPHFHILLHTNTPERLVKETEWFVSKDGRKLLRDSAWLRTTWKFGFTSFEFARDERAVVYVTKYISKGMECRVRNSNRYGILEVHNGGPSPTGLGEERDRPQQGENR